MKVHISHREVFRSAGLQAVTQSETGILPELCRRCATLLRPRLEA